MSFQFVLMGYHLMTLLKLQNPFQKRKCVSKGIPAITYTFTFLKFSLI